MQEGDESLAPQLRFSLDADILWSDYNNEFFDLFYRLPTFIIQRKLESSLGAKSCERQLSSIPRFHEGVLSME